MLLHDWQNCFFTTCSLIIYKSAGLIFTFHSVENVLAKLCLNSLFAFCMLKISLEVIFFLAFRLEKQISSSKFVVTLSLLLGLYVYVSLHQIPKLSWFENMEFVNLRYLDIAPNYFKSESTWIIELFKANYTLFHTS